MRIWDLNAPLTKVKLVVSQPLVQYIKKQQITYHICLHKMSSNSTKIYFVQNILLFTHEKIFGSLILHYEEIYRIVQRPKH